MAQSPVAILFNTDGIEAMLKDGVTLPANIAGIMLVGKDGTTARFLSVDATGKLAVQNPPNLDVALSTRATEATLSTLLTEATFAAEDFASETTLAAILVDTGQIETLLTSLDGKDYATQTTLATLLADSTFTGSVGEVQASPTQYTLLSRLKEINDTLVAEDFATETTLSAILVDTGQIETLLTAIKDTDGIKKITDPVAMAGSGGALGSITDDEGNERLAVDSLTKGVAESGSYPDPSSIIIGQDTAYIDHYGNLRVRGPVTTDEESFRDGFSGSTLGTDLTGTVTLTNGSTTVTATGGSFPTEVRSGDWIRLTADGQSAYTEVDYVVDDNTLELSEPYSAAGGSGTARVSSWKPVTTTGGSVGVTSSAAQLTTNTTSGARATIYRYADYQPFRSRVRCSISARRSNQAARIGFVDDPSSPVEYVYLEFDGTTSTSLKFVTAGGPNAEDIQTSQITLTGTITTTQRLNYTIDVTGSSAVLYINDQAVATHTINIPGPYTTLAIYADLENTGTTAGSTTLELDYVYFQNYNQVQVANSSDPIRVVVVSSTSATGTSGQAIGQLNSSGVSAVPVRSTIYTEPTSGAAAKEVVSNNAADTAAGTGARQLKITYYDDNCNGPFAVTLTMNGTTPVSVGVSNMRYIEKIEVVDVGSAGWNVGVLTLRHVTGPTTIGTVAATINQTQWCHHYVPTGSLSRVTGMSYGNKGTAGGGAYVSLKDLTTTSYPERQITEVVRCPQGGFSTRNFQSPVQISGPARLVGYVIPDTNNMDHFLGFDYSEQVL